ncbi:HEAT repeats [Candidatus Bilamarchaeum dharawalense]|uniref:HEAT repeats n=1 Tax=Candidatus Bilamarchaeum dharawalense TaxID=2885759 RepID=A0A5E4LQF0_9ARCH|nr:HEAT repeats [Candidatus Bilamarchaeum dharawalense]
MDSVTANINKLVSLTFDEKPEVRKRAAKSLGELNDPAAVFALVELSYDKDPSVRAVAQQYLDKRKQNEPELMSFANIFSASDEEKKNEVKVEEAPSETREKMLKPITQLFEKHLGKEKAETVRNKLMPSIEKMYAKAHQQHGSKKKTEEAGRKVMQEFLTSYLEVMSDLDQIGDGPTPPVEKRPVVQETHVVPHEEKQEPPKLLEDEISGEIGEVGKNTELDTVSTEIATLESNEIEEMKEHEEIERLPDTFFKKAYETMMLSGGDEDIMKQEMEHMVNEARREILQAFKMARAKFKEMKITNITKIRNGMRNINTDMLIVKTVETMEYQKTKKLKASLMRVLVNDETGNEGVIYLFDDRGAGLKPGLKIKVISGLVKAFNFAGGETALTVGKKGNVYIVL